MSRSNIRISPGLSLRRAACFALLCCFSPASLYQIAPAQDPDTAEQKTVDETGEDAPPVAPAKVNVEQVVEDVDIAVRLRQILEATEWFQNPAVRVDDGVAFVSGITDNEKYREWAGQVAGNTEDVVAVVNRITVTDPPVWNFEPAWVEVRSLGRSTIQSLPLLVLAILILAGTWLTIRIGVALADRSFLRKIETGLLREVVRKAIVVPLVLVGLYLVLKVSGLSRLAVTVLGGTGLFGLIIGIAFRDIAENFLASVLLSMQNPFRYGDLIEVAGYEGFVQRVNTRGTLLMTLDGNHIQIPNSTIYKSTIQNFTANPNRRFEFTVGVGYDVPVSRAQETAMRVLTDHPAVLDDPEPQVLVEGLGPSTVNMRVFAWINTELHSGGKVLSSLIRLVKAAFEQHGFAMPDDHREVIFPQGVPIFRQHPSDDATTAALPDEPAGSILAPASAPEKSVLREETSNPCEGDFASEAESIKEQARRSRDPDEGSSDLLDSGREAEPPTKPDFGKQVASHAD